jgi:hypothetical protein
MVAFITALAITGVAGFILSCGFIYASCKLIDLETQEAENEATALEIKKENNTIIRSMCEDGTLSPEQCAEVLSASDEVFDEDATIFDKIGDALGVNSKTAIWILGGIVAFSMLKG